MMKDFVVLLLVMAWLPAVYAQSEERVMWDGFEFVASTSNDSGQDWCAMGDVGDLSCPQVLFPNQDAEYGRDARARLGELTKLGGGEAGFDFTKISNRGDPLPESAVLGSGPLTGRVRGTT